MTDQISDNAVRVPKIAEIVAGKIRRRIVLGEITAGNNLPTEAQLAESFDVSRPTIREAMRILEFEELISVSRGSRGGPKVRAQSPGFVARAMGLALQAGAATLGDVYHARAMIEPLAARLAAESRPKQAAANLRAHIAREYEAIKTATVIPVVTAEFHRLLMVESGNKTLALVGIALSGLVEKHQALAHRGHAPELPEAARKRSRLGIRSHEKLTDLIEAGDAAGAEAHWRRHMDKSGEFYLDQLGGKAIVDIMSE